MFINDIRVGSARYDIAREKITDLVNISIPTEITNENVTLKITAVDIQGFSNKATQTVGIVDKDTIPPQLENARVIKKPDNSYDVTMFFSDSLSAIKNGKVTQNGQIIHTIQGSLTNFSMNNTNPVTVEVTDSYNNTLTQQIELSKYLSQ